MTPRVISPASMANSHSSGMPVKFAPTRGMWANGSRSSSHCGNPANEPIRYKRDESDQNAPGHGRESRCETEQSDRHRGQQPDGGQLDGRACHHDSHLAADVAGGDAVDQAAGQSADQHRHRGSGQRRQQMACQPTGSRHRTRQRRFGPLARFLLVQPQRQRDGECGSRHAHHGERDGDEGFLQSAGAAHPDDDVACGVAAAELVADAVHHTAHQHAVEAKTHGPQQERSAVQPPRQPEHVAQRGCGGAGTGAFGEESGAHIAAGEQPICQRGERRRSSPGAAPAPTSDRPRRAGLAATSPAVRATTARRNLRRRRRAA